LGDRSLICCLMLFTLIPLPFINWCHNNHNIDILTNFSQYFTQNYLMESNQNKIFVGDSHYEEAMPISIYTQIQNNICDGHTRTWIINYPLFYLVPPPPPWVVLEDVIDYEWQTIELYTIRFIFAIISINCQPLEIFTLAFTHYPLITPFYFETSKVLDVKAIILWKCL